MPDQTHNQPHHHSPYSLATLIDLQTQLASDRNLSDTQKLERDIPFTQSLQQSDRTSRILAWLSHASPSPTRTSQYIFLISSLITILGLILGFTLAKAVYHYDGSVPINIILPIAIFMAAQLLLSILTILAMLPNIITRHIPLFTSLQDALITLNPGNIIHLILKLLPTKHQPKLTALLGDLQSTQTIFANLQKWTILRHAQALSLAINIAAILTFIFLITFSDLAFAWSTTLNLTEQSIHTLTQTIALPYAYIPNTSPTSQLIENTQFFRGNPTGFDPKLARDWWPFLLALMITYGLIPRLLLYFIAVKQHRRTIKQTITNLPAAITLLTRLDHLQAAPQNPTAQSQTQPPPTQQQPQAQPTSSYNMLIVDDAPQPKDFPYTPAVTAHFAGKQSIQEDTHALNLITTDLDPSTQIIILVKLWEPPTQEIIDLLQSLRSMLDKQTPILITPTPIDTANNTVTTHPDHLHHWSLKVRSLSDPYTLINPALIPNTSQPEHDA